MSHLMVGFGLESLLSARHTGSMDKYVLVPPPENTTLLVFFSSLQPTPLSRGEVLTQKTFLGYTTALALQIPPQSTIVQWLYSTRFSVLIPPHFHFPLIGFQNTSRNFNRQRDKSSHARRDQASLKPRGHRYPQDEARESCRDEDNGLTDNRNLLIQWISPQTLLVERKIKRPTVGRGKSANEGIDV